MGIVELQNVLILMILGLVICGLSILKRRLLRLSADLSEKALRRRFIMTNPARDFC